MGKKWTADKVMSARKPNSATAKILLDPDIAAELEELGSRLSRLKATSKGSMLDEEPEEIRLANAIQKLEKKAADQTVTFVFQGIGRRRWAQLLAEYPPTKEQRKEHNAQWDVDRFPPAAVAESCVEPEGMTVDLAQQMWDEWEDGQISKMWRACLQANLGEVDVEGKAASRLAFETLRSIGAGSQQQSD